MMIVNKKIQEIMINNSIMMMMIMKRSLIIITVMQNSELYVCNVEVIMSGGSSSRL